jgi:hypothetical protein
LSSADENLEAMITVELRCNKCERIYGFDDDGPFFVSVEPGIKILSFEHPCPDCQCAYVMVVTVSWTSDKAKASGVFDSVLKEIYDEEWPEFIDTGNQR